MCLLFFAAAPAAAAAAAAHGCPPAAEHRSLAGRRTLSDIYAGYDLAVCYACILLPWFGGGRWPLEALHTRVLSALSGGLVDEIATGRSRVSAALCDEEQCIPPKQYMCCSQEMPTRFKFKRYCIAVATRCS